MSSCSCSPSVLCYPSRVSHFVMRLVSLPNSHLPSHLLTTPPLACHQSQPRRHRRHRALTLRGFIVKKRVTNPPIASPTPPPACSPTTPHNAATRPCVPPRAGPSSSSTTGTASTHFSLVRTLQIPHRTPPMCPAGRTPSHTTPAA